MTAFAPFNRRVIAMTAGITALFASWTCAGEGRTAGDFLLLPGDAKGAAMGEANTAAAEGANGLWANPAALVKKKAPHISLMHNMYLEDISFNSAALSLPLGQKNALGIGAEYLTAGSIDSFDNAGQAASSFSPKDLCARLGFARTLFETQIGLAVSTVKSTIQNTATALLWSWGLHHDLGPVSIAMAHENLGGSLKFHNESSPLPKRLKFGFSCRFLPNWLIETDVIRPAYGASWNAVGTEASFPLQKNINVSLRAGYNNRDKDDVTGSRGLSAGAGFALSEIELNYAWVPFGDLGQTHRLSLEFALPSLMDSDPEGLFKKKKAVFKQTKLARPQARFHSKNNFFRGSPFPWKWRWTGFRTADRNVMDLLAQDAVCSLHSPQAVVTKIKGRVTVISPYKSKTVRTAKKGLYLFQGDTLETTEASYAHVVFANNVRTEVGPNTMLQIEAEASTCERPVVVLERGNLYSIPAPQKEIEVRTPFAQFSLQATAETSLANNLLSLKVISGSATVTSDKESFTVPERHVFTKSADNHDMAPLPPTALPKFNGPIAMPDENSTPGRWDVDYAAKFKQHIRQIDSMPDLKLGEYARDSKLRDLLKMTVFDLKLKETELQAQLLDFNRDLLGFKELKDALKKPVPGESKADRKERLENYKNTRLALQKVQKSQKNLDRELKNLMLEVRENQEWLASIPIVRMLNITAAESAIPFETARAVIPEQAAGTLDSIAEAIVQLKPHRIIIEGHTDQTGSRWSNTRLSKQRAQAVAQHLRQKTNLPAQRFITKGMGSSRPLEPPTNPESIGRNRRVEIWLELRGL